MLDAFKDTSKYFSIRRRIVKPRAINTVFRLHYQLTFGILGVAVILVTGYSYIDTNGASIQCMMDKGTQIPGDVINNYCWIMSTYSLPKYYDGVVGKEVIAHGVGPHEGGALDPISLKNGEVKEEQIYHAYYQWVPLFLSLQAIMFYFPYYVWRQFDGNRFVKVLNGLNLADFSDKNLQDVITYFKERLGQDMSYEHNWWAGQLYFCELLNFINVVIQIKFTDTFLGGAFSQYGLEAASWSGEEDDARVDPMYRVFPRMTKCMFHKFGVSGTIEKFDVLCILGMNIINEKIFVFLWFWYVILAIISGFVIIERIAELLIPSLRIKMLQIEQFGIKFHAVDKEKLEDVLEDLAYSDWLLLYCLAKCMDRKAFKQLIDAMPAKINKTRDEERQPLKSEEEDEDVEKQPSSMFDQVDDAVPHGGQVDLHRNETMRSNQRLTQPPPRS